MKSIIAIMAVVCVTACEGWGIVDDDAWGRLMLQGTTEEKVGHYAAAAAYYYQAVHLSETTQLGLALALNSLARTEDELGKFAEAESLYRRSLTILERAGD